MAFTASPAACSVLNEVQEIEQAALQDVIAVRERVSQPCCSAMGSLVLHRGRSVHPGTSVCKQMGLVHSCTVSTLACGVPAVPLHHARHALSRDQAVQATGTVSLQCLLCA